MSEFGGGEVNDSPETTADTSAETSADTGGESSADTQTEVESEGNAEGFEESETNDNTDIQDVDSTSDEDQVGFGDSDVNDEDEETEEELSDDSSLGDDADLDDSLTSDDEEVAESTESPENESQEDNTESVSDDSDSSVQDEIDDQNETNTSDDESPADEVDSQDDKNDESSSEREDGETLDNGEPEDDLDESQSENNETTNDNDVSKENNENQSDRQNTEAETNEPKESEQNSVVESDNSETKDMGQKPTSENDNGETNVDEQKVAEESSQSETNDVKSSEEAGREQAKETETLDDEQKEKIKEITQPYYEKSREVAENDPDGVGQNFTDHTEIHVEQVAEKSEQAAAAFEDTIDNGTLQTQESIEENNANPDRVNFQSGIDHEALEAAALSHDVGMSGGYKVSREGINENGDKVYKVENAESFKDIRDNHSLNSAIDVLANREQYKQAGFSDEQVDTIAAECMAHSKSCSGVKDLNSKQEWSECFNKMDAVIDKYNEDHSDEKISFDRTAFEQNDEKMGQLATSSLALRVGDVSRDSGEGAITQSGDEIHVDRAKVDDSADNLLDEIRADCVTRGEAREFVENEKSKQVHIGEQNITNNVTTIDSEGKLLHEITVDNMDSAPYSTQNAIEEHIGEFATAKDAKVNIDIKCDNNVSDETKEKYEQFRKDIDDATDDNGNPKHENIMITYPWDKN